MTTTVAQAHAHRSRGSLRAERWMSEEGMGNKDAELKVELMGKLMADGLG